MWKNCHYYCYGVKSYIFEELHIFLSALILSIMNFSVIHNLIHSAHRSILHILTKKRVSYKSVAMFLIDLHIKFHISRYKQWILNVVIIYFFYHGATAPSRPRPPHCRGFTITLRHTTFGRTPLDKWSGRRRNLYLTTHNTHNRRTSMPQAAFEPALPASERPQTHPLHRAATRIGDYRC